MDRNQTGISDYDEVSDVLYDEYDEGEEDAYHNSIRSKVNLTEKSIKTIFGFIIGALALLVVLLIVFFAVKNSAKKKQNDTKPDVSTTTEIEEPEDTNYTPGEYVVSASGSLRLRSKPSMEAEHIMSVPSKTKLNITEVRIDKNAATEDSKYWGKTTFKGTEAWVCLSFMTKTSSTLSIIDNSTTLPEEETFDFDETTKENSDETTNPDDNNDPLAETTDPASGETTSSTSSSSNAYSTGKYTYNDGDLNVRSQATVSSDNPIKISAGSVFTVTEIKEDPNAENDTLRYWGRVTYNNVNGWVCMSLLQSAE